MILVSVIITLIGCVCMKFAACSEAYEVSQDRTACTIGCDSMARQRVSDLMSLLSVFYLEEGLDYNMLLMSLDMPENDAMTDPGLRKELLPGWWDTEGFKLPQTFIKTVPRDPEVNKSFVSCYNKELLERKENWIFKNKIITHINSTH